MRGRTHETVGAPCWLVLLPGAFKLPLPGPQLGRESYAGSESVTSMTGMVPADPARSWGVPAPTGPRLALFSSLSPIDTEQHYKWIINGTNGLRGKGRARMRPKLQLLVLGHAFRAAGVMAQFAIVNLKAVLCHIDLFESS